MKKLLTVFLCSFFLFGTVAVCSAVGFTLNSYTVSKNFSDPGLVIQTSEILAEPTTLDLDPVGDFETRNLFRIWTNENTVHKDEDEASKPISVAMNFTAPTIFDGTIGGVTSGERYFYGFYQQGRLTWSGTQSFSFGSGGILNVTLSDETFNGGYLGLDEGYCSGAIVQATFTYGAASAPVPEPSTILLMGVGLLGLVAVGRRKFNSKE